MNPIMTLEGQDDLPRYFAATFALARKLKNGRIDFRLPDGRVFSVDAPNPGPVGEIVVHNPDVFARLIREGDLGFADAYLEGWWSTPDLQSFMDVIHADNDDVYDSFGGLQIVRMWERFRHWMNRNTKEQAKKNISHHYDLGNEFYELWLDDTMTYSSALFQTGQESLENAQTLKYKSMV
ncbi:MAG: SAM-dependent methyltransferase, partial [Silicimonas sp.]|nr:SAM-dependent methyltransferase [Silicimonas sp.]